MKKPIKENYCKPFSFDSKLQTFNSKQYAKDAENYINFLHTELIQLANRKTTPLKVSSKIYSLINL